jgi:tRNA dimethylallyltransferase
MEDQRLITIVGPTASGKSKLAIDLAAHIDAEIISADSMQVYKYMDIGTGKSSSEDRQRIPHHLVDIIFPDEDFSAAHYKERARAVIDVLVRRGKNIIVAGGTGLYIRALINGLFPSPAPDYSMRGEMKEKAERLGNVFLWNELKELDPVSASRLHPHDTVRIIRALEVQRQTGFPLSQWQEKHSFGDSPYRVLQIGLMRSREDINRRIEKRVDRMVRRGLEGEVKSLLDMGYGRRLKSMQGLGYKQMAEYLQGERGFDEAIYLIKRETKAYAKRQFTWFRADRALKWVDHPREKRRIFEMAEQFLDRKPHTVRKAVN